MVRCWHFRRISAEYPRRWQTLLRDGFSRHENDSASPRVAIISRALAEQYWPNDDAVGKQIHRAERVRRRRPFEVVGVVGDAMDGGCSKHPRADRLRSCTPRCRNTRIQSVLRILRGEHGHVHNGKSCRAINAGGPAVVAPSGIATLGTLVSTANALPHPAAILMVFANCRG